MSCDNVIIGGVEYVPKLTKPHGNRAVVVVDRGWIFAGDVERRDGRIILSNVTWVFKWQSIGFAGMIEDPTNKNVTLRKMETQVILPEGAEIFCVPVAADWGL